MLLVWLLQLLLQLPRESNPKTSAIPVSICYEKRYAKRKKDTKIQQQHKKVCIKVCMCVILVAGSSKVVAIVAADDDDDDDVVAAFVATVVVPIVVVVAVVVVVVVVVAVASPPCGALDQWLDGVLCLMSALWALSCAEKINQIAFQRQQWQ